MKRFIARYADKIIGVLSGFDRLVFRGHLRRISYVAGMTLFLNVRRVLFKNFRDFVSSTTERLKKASFEAVQKLDRPTVHVASSKADKEAIARKIAHKDKITEGLVALLKCTEPCTTFGIGPNPKTNILELRSELGQCMHLYYYFIDPVFGWMHARIQTWFPFNVQICLNGRDWLARQMDHAGLAYRKRDNCFPWIEDFPKAQKLMDLQLKANWPRMLDRIAAALNPLHPEIFRDFSGDYYWSAYQSEWASDIVFESQAALDNIYPALVHHAISSFGSADVLRFLGGKAHGCFQGEITSDFHNRPEGIRVKHWVGPNSIKLYNKQGNILRAETTIQNPNGFKVFRPKQGDPRGKKEWRPLRKGIADLHRRAEVSQASNERYLDAFAPVDTSTPVGELVRDLCRPTSWKGKRVRALRPWDPHDLKLFQTISRGEFSINGFRNRDLQSRLYDRALETQEEKRRRSGRVTRLIRLLRAHHLIKKVNATHRYVLTQLGHDLIPAILQTHLVTLHQLRKAVA